MPIQYHHLSKKQLNEFFVEITPKLLVIIYLINDSSPSSLDFDIEKIIHVLITTSSYIFSALQTGENLQKPFASAGNFKVSLITVSLETQIFFSAKAFCL